MNDTEATPKWKCNVTNFQSFNICQEKFEKCGFRKYIESDVGGKIDVLGRL